MVTVMQPCMERNPDLDLSFGAHFCLKCWAVFDVNGFSIPAKETLGKPPHLQRWRGIGKGNPLGAPSESLGSSYSSGM